MSARAISEASGKRLLDCQLEANCGAAVCRFASVDTETDWDRLVAENAWLNSEVSVGVLLCGESNIKYVLLCRNW